MYGVIFMFQHYTLVEFSSSQSAADMVKDARFFPSDEGNFVVPHQSRLLYLKFKKEGNSTSAESKQCTDTRVTPITVTNKLNLQTGSTVCMTFKSCTFSSFKFRRCAYSSPIAKTY